MEHAPYRVQAPKRIVEHRCMDCGSNVCFKDGNGIRRCERCGSANVRLVDVREVKAAPIKTGELAIQILKVTKDAIVRCVTIDNVNTETFAASINIDTDKINRIINMAKEATRLLQEITCG